MTCQDARELFSALVDDALGSAERDALDAHLATCADCGRELQRFRDTVALLRSVEPARAPAGFVDRVLGAARPAPWPRRLLRALFLPWPVKLPVEAAAVVLVAVGVVYVFRATPELQRGSRLESTQHVGPATPRDAVSEPSPPAPSREMYHQAQEKDQASEKQRMQKKSAAAPPAARDEAELRAASPGDASRDIGRHKEESRPAAPAEPQVAETLAAPPARAEREPGAAQESARLPAAPAPESRADALHGRRPATGSPTVTSVTPPDVSGRLAVADRAAALRSLAQLITRLGAVEDRRVEGDEGPIIELTISREVYAEFVRELARLGRWQPTREAAALPAQVRVVLRITS